MNGNDPMMLEQHQSDEEVRRLRREVFDLRVKLADAKHTFDELIRDCQDMLTMIENLRRPQ